MAKGKTEKMVIVSVQISEELSDQIKARIQANLKKTGHRISMSDFMRESLLKNLAG